MSSSNRLLNLGKKACGELREFIAGQRKLTPAEVDARRGFVKEASKESLYFFAKEVLGFSKMLPNPHKRWADDLQAKWLEVDYFGRLKPRGTFKTTLYGESFILWVWACFSAKIRFFYTSANATLLEEVAAHLDYYVGELSESLYSFVFGIRRDPKAKKNTVDVFNVTGRDDSAKGSSLMFRTAGGSTNGVHPHVVLIDDPCDSADRTSEATRDSKRRWFDSLIPLLVPYDLKVYAGEELVRTVSVKKMMLIATRWHLDDLPSHIMTKPGWDFEIEGVYDEDGNPLYPELLPEPLIQAIREQIDSIFFACQYENNPLPEGTLVFDPKRLHLIRPEQFDIKQGTNLCYFDPAQGKQGNDFPAPVWFNVLNGRKVLFEAIDRKIGLTVLIGMVAHRNKELCVREMIVETNGSLSIVDTLERAHRDIGHRITITGIHETRNKEERIQLMQPVLYRSDWMLRADHDTAYPELWKQLTRFPVWKNDDFPDVIEKAVSHLEANLPGTFSGQSAAGTAERKPFSAPLNRQAASW